MSERRLPLWLHALDGSRAAAVVRPMKLEIDCRLQSSETLACTLDLRETASEYVAVDRIVEYDERRYRITSCQTIRDGASTVVEFVAEALWIDLLSSWIRAPLEIVGKTPGDGLETLLEDTAWTLGTIEDDSGSYSLTISSDQTVLSQLRSWAALTLREIVFDTKDRTVSLVFQEGDATGRIFRYGRDVRSLKRSVEPPAATRLVPIGAEGLGIAAVNPSGEAFIENFSYYTEQGLSLEDARALYTKTMIWTDTKYVAPVNLFDAATERLAGLSRPVASYEMSVADLSAVSDSFEPVELGDTVRVVDDDLRIDIQTRVVRSVSRPLVPEATSIELEYLASGLDPYGAAATGGGSDGSSGLTLLIDHNIAAFEITNARYQTNSLALSFTNGGNLVTGYELDGVATGSGVVRVETYWGATRVGAVATHPFAAGAFHLSVVDGIAGLEGSRNLYVTVSVSSGTGTVAIDPEASRLYVLATGLSGGGTSTNSNVDANERIFYAENDLTIADSVTVELI